MISHINKVFGGFEVLDYKRIDGATQMINSHELTFKQLKHFLRQIIGFHAAKYYILSHGKRIVFVKPAESFNGVLKFLKSIDHR